jgi:hypothetical protein
MPTTRLHWLANTIDCRRLDCLIKESNTHTSILDMRHDLVSYQNSSAWNTSYLNI